MRFTPTAAFGANVSSRLIQILLIGGGGGGGAITGSFGARTFLESGAGGGAGGYVSRSIYIYDSSSFTLSIGQGGQGGCLDTTGTPCGYSTNGEDSIFSVSSSAFDTHSTQTFTAYGGGFGGSYNTITAGQANGGDGGSGGGNNGLAPYGQGFPGATIYLTSAGGGGGANEQGRREDSGNIGGGDGKLWFDGNYYAGGGGAGVESVPGLPNYGGLGGGGRGGYDTGVGTYAPNGTAGTANTGGGGGGKGRQQNTTGAGTFYGGAGGSGVCKIRYYGSGSIFNQGSSSYNSSDGYTYVTFTGSVSFKNF